MASANLDFDRISELSDSVSEPCVEPKTKPSNEPKNSDDIRSKAFTPEQLPKDFLRVMLNEQQVNETTDEELARRLQFGQQNQNAVRHLPSHYKGRLQIDICEAQLNKNYGLVKMDPYVRMTINNKVYETPTDYSGAKNPKWNKTIMCYIPNNVEFIKFEIFDEKSFTDDEIIAVVKYPLPKSLFTECYVDEWLPLSGKLGEQKEGSINVRISFTSMTQLQKTERARSSFSQEIPGLYPDPPLNEQLPPELVAQRMAEQSDLNRAIQLSQRESVPVEYSEEDLKSIYDMFPSFDKDIVKSLMAANNGNKGITIEKILEMTTDN